MGLILETLGSTTRVQFSRLLKGIEGIQAKMHGVMTLLASLELTRRRAIFLRQTGPFQELWIYRQEEELPVIEDEEPDSEGAQVEAQLDAEEADATDGDAPEADADEEPKETS